MIKYNNVIFSDTEYCECILQYNDGSIEKGYAIRIKPNLSIPVEIRLAFTGTCSAHLIEVPQSECEKISPHIDI